ncbi:MAG: hypothetical protein RMI43_01785 [Candidatus Caldarchaeum sp.]|nr:hypothetical protein [Candidatus Caldarchaeum sp.]
MLGETFIVVWEGVDGSGKTTLLNAVYHMLSERRFRVAKYKTPSSSPTGLFAQQHGNKPETDPLTRMLLFLANTADDSATIKQIIEQTKPDFLLIDRYNLCSVVYGFSLNAKKFKTEIQPEEFKKFFETIEKLGSKVFVTPDVVVVVTVDPETRRQRTTLKQTSSDRIFETDEELQNIVEHYYNLYADWRPNQVIKVLNRDNMVDRLASELAEKFTDLRRKSLHG